MQSCPRHKGSAIPWVCTLITGRILEEGAWDLADLTKILLHFFQWERGGEKMFWLLFSLNSLYFNLFFLENISPKPLIMYTYLAPFSIVLLCIYWLDSVCCFISQSLNVFSISMASLDLCFWTSMKIPGNFMASWSLLLQSPVTIQNIPGSCFRSIV